MNSRETTLKLNIRVLIDAFENYYNDFHFHIGQDRNLLTGIRFYDAKESLQPQYVYIAAANALPLPLDTNIPTTFIFQGNLSEPLENRLHSYIELPDDISLTQIYNIASAAFEKYFSWDTQLQNALNHDEGIRELCKISYDFFGNPLFIHDAQFYVVACPALAEGMNQWEKDERTGAEMVPFDLINTFRHDQEYQQTLSTKGANIYSRIVRGYRILYINLWYKGRYEGRICVNEITTPLQKGHFCAIEHFAKVIQIAIRRRNIEPGSFSRAIENILADLINKKNMDTATIADNICLLGWHAHDDYACIKVDSESHNMDVMAAVGTCNHIEEILDGSCAFLYENNILILVNLSFKNLTIDDCIEKIAYLLREGLLKMGISNVFSDIIKLPIYYQQAAIALNYGANSGRMEWHYLFSDYTFDYILDNASGNFPGEILYSEAVLRLQAYDKKRNTSYLLTLATYLRNERNSMQTARDLHIHRSTLFYRLDRIKDITNLDLDNYKTRLYTEFSIEMLCSEDRRQKQGK